MIHRNHLAKTVAKIQDNSLSVAEYLGELRTRTEAIEPEIESLLPESDRWARLTAAADQLAGTPYSARKPLYGIPVGVKDIIHASGFQTRANSSLPPEQLTGPEATVVQQLKSAGALVFGKTVTAEFAYSEPGPTKNPHDTDHTPGGSSSGSAAAVAAGLCPLALGTQTVGSTIRPAAFCGIVGFKPSYGRVSVEGIIPLSQSVDTVGFFTQDVAGAEIAASVLCEGWQTIPDGMDRPTIGVPDGPYLNQASSDGLDRFYAHCHRLEQAGYDVETVPVLPDIETINTYHERLIAAEAAMVHHEWYQEHGEKYGAQTAELIEEGYGVPTSEIATGRTSRTETRTHLTDVMDDHDIDIWIAPGACGPAPEDIDSTGDPVMNLPWTHAGLPTIAIPTGDRINGLPIGVQCVTYFNADEHLLSWARDIARTLHS